MMRRYFCLRIILLNQFPVIGMPFIQLDQADDTV